MLRRGPNPRPRGNLCCNLQDYTGPPLHSIYFPFTLNIPLQNGTVQLIKQNEPFSISTIEPKVTIQKRPLTLSHQSRHQTLNFLNDSYIIQSLRPSGRLKQTSLTSTQPSIYQILLSPKLTNDLSRIDITKVKYSMQRKVFLSP